MLATGIGSSKINLGLTLLFQGVWGMFENNGVHDQDQHRICGADQSILHALFDT